MRLINPASSHLVLIDLQERLLPALPCATAMLTRVRLLVAAARELAVPITVTEQYPAGLGPTVAEIAAALPDDAPRIEKIAFSGVEAIETHLVKLSTRGRRSLVVCGAEAHVCVLQTVIDALNGGFGVVLAADAVASRRRVDEEIALRRMAAAGAMLATTEMIVFEWLRQAGTPAFRALAPAIKALGSDKDDE